MGARPAADSLIDHAPILTPPPSGICMRRASGAGRLESPTIPRRRRGSGEGAAHPQTAAHIRRRRRTSRDDGPHPATTPYIPRRRPTSRDDGPHPETTPYIPRRRLTSRDKGPHPETMAYIPRRRPTSRDDGPHPETMPYIPRRCAISGEVAAHPETMAWIWRSCPTFAGVTKRGERAGHAPQRMKEVSYFDSAGEAAVGVGWPSGVSGGFGLAGFALRTRPRNGCRPNCASFSERRP